MNTLQTRYNPSFSAASSNGIEELLTVAEDGNFVLSLPTNLQDYQQELERLLGKCFSGRAKSEGTLALARQMSINWCLSKCKQTGQSVDQCLDLLS
ncbi:hypothetical protein KBI23_08755 [bacterium]|jgi:hypothetical protein|nr:hypothetical protein [bacterium]MBP9810646.1 hypothetical protein [bacterium]MDP3508494.1 hypothetical protein [Candidatus Melainabacteria bacterium]